MLRLFIRILLFLLLPLLGLTAAEPIRFGVTLGLTGKDAELADMQKKGFLLWQKHVNKRGGILGRNVEIIVYDDNNTKDTAKLLYETLILKDKVDLLFGPYSSGITGAILPITEKYEYPVLVSGASADELWKQGYKYVFGIFIPASRYAVGFLEVAAGGGVTDIAIVYADDTFSKSIASGTKEWAERFGLRIALYKEFKKGKENLDDIASEAKASGAKGLIVCGHFNEAVAMRLSLENVRWIPKAYFASVGPVLQAYYDKLGTKANHTFSSSQWEYHESLNMPAGTEFYRAFINTYGTPPSYHAATAYAAGEIFEAAIAKAKTTDRKKIRHLLSKMNTMSILGKYGVDSTGMQIKHFTITIQWQNGRKEVVWPKELMTSTPVFE
ncbi:amino acid ABC transporter substrate-binding protein [Candidatus Magnetobacterium casense]|uniref:amino acid ABC transporter substrate-binding protein n=1 Tax=Candidatus Magnetobacterium casense TaxID=1455061 RepID=UPI00058F7954|nr:amino acid ABC transporter substrate-binding protein [Candidatus Magnetobacterium casensis]